MSTSRPLPDPRRTCARSWKPWLRGTAFGFPFGALPAGGAEIPTFLSYATEKRLTKHPEEFGKGAIEGVAGPEAANNAAAAGVLVPLLTLGLPTSATAAILLAAFQGYGIQPGPTLLTTESTLVWTLIASLFIGNVMLLVLNLPLVGIWVKLLRIPRPYLYAGHPAVRLARLVRGQRRPARPGDPAAVIGLLGFAMRRFGWPVAPAVIGLILGPVAETNLRRAIAIGEGNPVGPGAVAVQRGRLRRRAAGRRPAARATAAPRPAGGARGGERGMTAVVVGYVPRPEGRAALARGIAEARLRETRLVVVNATRGDALVDERFVQGDRPRRRWPPSWPQAPVPTELRQLERRAGHRPAAGGGRPGDRCGPDRDRPAPPQPGRQADPGQRRQPDPAQRQRPGPGGQGRRVDPRARRSRPAVTVWLRTSRASRPTASGHERLMRIMRVQGTDSERRHTISGLVAQLETRLIDLRRDIHAHPEVGNLEHRTTAVIVEELERAGLVAKVLPIGTGAYCDILPDGFDYAEGLIGFRADIDALPITDAKDVPYASQNPGVCHACGHDVHTAILLGLGLVLARLRDARPAAPRRTADLPAGRGDQPGRRAGRDRRRGAAGPDRDLRAALRPADRRRPARLQGRADHLRGRPGRHHPDRRRRAHVPAAPDPGHHRRPRRAGHHHPAGAVPAGRPAQRGVADVGLGPRRLGGQRDPGHAARSWAPCGRSTWPAGSRPSTCSPSWPPTSCGRSGSQVEVEVTDGVPPAVNHAAGHPADDPGHRAGARVPSAIASTEQSLGGEDFAWMLQQVPGALARLGVRTPGRDVSPTSTSPPSPSTSAASRWASRCWPSWPTTGPEHANRTFPLQSR